MGKKLATTLATAGLGLALVVGGAVAPASAAPEVWYKITGYSQQDCLKMQGYYHNLGAQIVTVCKYRSYDQKWAFSYYWK
jgi:hypothetical protein